MSRRWVLSLLPVLGASACAPAALPPPAEPAPLEATHEEVRDYLRMLAPRLVRRPLAAAEVARIDAEGPLALRPIVRSWVEEEPRHGSAPGGSLPEAGFILAARDMVEHLLKTSGRLDDIDYDLPGNLAAHIVREELPYSRLLTAEYCVDRSGAQIECDTTAPYTAGVLTTRAYLAANASRFNLRRATTLMKVFACRAYPMSPELQPRVTKQELIPMFRAQNEEEQTVAEVASGFGNGLGCYTCHSQFASHAQLFVKFDSSGLWRSYAHGLQNDFGELGRSIGRFFASHFAEPRRSEDESGQVFGQQVANLAEAGRVIAADGEFLPCAVRRTFEYAFDIDETSSSSTDPELYRSIAEDLRERGHRDPSFAALFTAVVTHPAVFRAILDQR